MIQLLELTTIDSIQDIIEISFITLLTFYFIKWLATDNKKNLVYYFYGYCFSAFVSHYCSLFALRYVLLNSAPVIAIMFIVLHQKALQKNFVMLKNEESRDLSNNWVDELIQTCLYALNYNKEFTCLIERDIAIKELISTQSYFNADISKDICNILLEKQLSSPENMLWINNKGKIVAINATWKLNIEEQWISSNVKSLPKWKQDALFITDKTDTILFKIYPLTRSFDFIINGKLIENLSVQQAFDLLQNNLSQNTKFIVKKDSQQQLRM